jgi:hypothetical protein
MIPICSTLYFIIINVSSAVFFSYPAHCSSCNFDLCDNCIKPYRSTYHPGHVLFKADSNVTYPRFNGGWRCDRCSRSFIPQMNNAPFHCSQCEFDLCDSCMKTTGDVSNAGIISNIYRTYFTGFNTTPNVHPHLNPQSPLFNKLFYIAQCKKKMFLIRSFYAR